MLSNDIVTFVYLTSNKSKATNPINAIDAINPLALYFNTSIANAIIVIATTT